MYQQLGRVAYKAKLSNTWMLAEYLNQPEKGFKSIHVAGTNGKGSVSHMLASILQEAGYKVGLYTSPHLKDFRERIKINGKEIPKEEVVDFVNSHKSFFEEHQLSFFEMTVGLAFDYFRNQKVDVAVIEVGLGGRLDSTNIIQPEVSVITNIGFDHTQFLGNTYESIAREKAGIIKEGIPVVIGERLPETRIVFEETAGEKDSELIYAEKLELPFYESDLKGAYQKINQRTVLAVLKVLEKKGWRIAKRAIERGLKKVVSNTGLMGRWQILQVHPKVICDTAHNNEGLRLVLKQVQSQDFDLLHIVLGMVSDKDFTKVLPLFPTDACYYFCAPDLPRAMPSQLLQERASEYGLKGEVYSSVKLAYQSALKSARHEDLIYVGGSTFVVAEVL